MTQHDALVAVAQHIDQLVDPGRAIGAVFPFLGLDRQLIGQFLMQPQRQLFAGNLSRDQPHRRIGQLILGVKPGPGRHFARQPVTQPVDPVATLCRDHEGALKRIGRVHLCRQAQQGFGLDLVDLVDRQRHPHPLPCAVLQRRQDRLAAFGQAAVRLDQQHHQIGIGGTAPGRSHHGAVEPAARAEQARRVDKHDLSRACHRHAANAGAGGLHLVGDNRDLGPDHAVQERRFPGIGFADQGDKAAAGYAGGSIGQR